MKTFRQRLLDEMQIHLELERRSLLTLREAYQVEISRATGGLQIKGPTRILEKLLRRLKRPNTGASWTYY